MTKAKKPLFNSLPNLQTDTNLKSNLEVFLTNLKVGEIKTQPISSTNTLDRDILNPSNSFQYDFEV